MTKARPALEYIPLPTPDLLELTIIEWGVLCYLSETCKSTQSGMTKASLHTIAAKLGLSPRVAWECLCRLHELKYVAVADHKGNQYVDHDVVQDVAVACCRANAAGAAAAMQNKLRSIPTFNARPKRPAPPQPRTSRTVIDKHADEEL